MELKRCPFCGGDAEYDNDDRCEFILCVCCGARMEKGWYSKEDVETLWNTRYENKCKNCRFWDKVEQNYDPRQYGECQRHVQCTPSHLTVEDFGCNKFKERE